MIHRGLPMASILVLGVIISAVAVSYTKFANRKLFVELHELRMQRDDLDVEWGRLRLEQSAWATHGRVESVARERLDMRIPQSEDVVLLAPAAGREP